MFVSSCFVRFSMAPARECHAQIEKCSHGCQKFFSCDSARPPRVNATHKWRSVFMLVKKCTGTRSVLIFAGPGLGALARSSRTQAELVGLGQPCTSMACLKAGNGWPWPALGSLYQARCLMKLPGPNPMASHGWPWGLGHWSGQVKTSGQPWRAMASRPVVL